MRPRNEKRKKSQKNNWLGNIFTVGPMLNRPSEKKCIFPHLSRFLCFFSIWPPTTVNLRWLQPDLIECIHVIKMYRNPSPLERWRGDDEKFNVGKNKRCFLYSPRSNIDVARLWCSSFSSFLFRRRRRNPEAHELSPNDVERDCNPAWTVVIPGEKNHKHTTLKHTFFVIRSRNPCFPGHIGERRGRQTK